MDSLESTGSTTGSGPDAQTPVKTTIALVQGDAAGVGPELMTRLLALDEVRERANILIVSDARVFRAGCEVTGLEPPIREIAAVADADYTAGVPNLLDVPAYRSRACAAREGLGRRRGRGAGVVRPRAGPRLGEEFAQSD